MSQVDQSTLKYMDKQINVTLCTEFSGETLDSTLSWQGQITKVIAKLTSACFSIKTLKLFLNIEDLRIVLLMFILLLRMVVPSGVMLLIAKMFLHTKENNKEPL
jgi:hypothetical protein